MNNQLPILAWHFSNGTLANGDGRKIVPGMALACAPDKIELCGYGLHASINLIGALRYAPGNVLSRVECGGNIIYGDNKLVCSQRRHLQVINIERVLHEFAIWCAEQALARMDNPDPSSLEALRIKRLWLDGQATDDELYTAGNVAGNVGRAAAKDSAWVAAWHTAGEAARDRGLAWITAWHVHNNQLAAMVIEALELTT